MTAPRVFAGQYEVVKQAGFGGMGEVWCARDRTLERLVAIKVLRPEMAGNRGAIERFHGEAVALARLNHPNIATLYAVVNDGADLCMVMEFVDGASLDRLLATRGRLPWRDVVAIGGKALAGIAHAHAAGVIHRDIKPANLMLTPSQQVKVMDFGIARMFDRSGLTREGNWVGTLEYVSPEQIRGEPLDGRADVYSLAIVLYELLTGRLPFAANTDFERMQAHLEKKPTPASHYVPDIPPALDAALMRAMAKSRAARFADATQFAEALAAVADNPVAARGGRVNDVAARVVASARVQFERMRDALRASRLPASGALAAARTRAWMVANPILAAASGLGVVAAALFIAGALPASASRVPSTGRIDLDAPGPSMQRPSVQVLQADAPHREPVTPPPLRLEPLPPAEDDAPKVPVKVAPKAAASAPAPAKKSVAAAPSPAPRPQEPKADDKRTDVTAKVEPPKTPPSAAKGSSEPGSTSSKDGWYIRR